jgi:hypothetical protein
MTDIAYVQEAVTLVQQKAFGPKFVPKNHPIKDGNEKTDGNGELRPEYAGMWFMSLTSIKKPIVKDRLGKVVVAEGAR